MDTVEKNDVDISKIFNWGRVYNVVNLKDDSVEADVYMKLLGDADLNRARVYALRKSAELRRELKDLNSDYRIAYIRDIDEVTEEDITNLIIVLSTREISQNASRAVKIIAPKQPKSTANLEKLEKFQKEVDEYPAKRRAAVEKAMTNAMDELRKELEGKSKDEIYKRYVKTMIDELCERQGIDAFTDMQVYLGCFSDDSYKPEARFFKDFEEFDNLEPTVKDGFKVAYNSLDIEVGELKKLRQATQ